MVSLPFYEIAYDYLHTLHRPMSTPALGEGPLKYPLISDYVHKHLIIRMLLETATGLRTAPVVRPIVYNVGRIRPIKESNHNS